MVTYHTILVEQEINTPLEGPLLARARVVSIKQSETIESLVYLRIAFIKLKLTNYGNLLDI